MKTLYVLQEPVLISAFFLSIAILLCSGLLVEDGRAQAQPRAALTFVLELLAFSVWYKNSYF